MNYDVDWGDAPEWAAYHTFDEDGGEVWHECFPVYGKRTWTSFGRMSEPVYRHSWRDSMTTRPLTATPTTKDFPNTTVEPLQIFKYTIQYGNSTVKMSILSDGTLELHSDNGKHHESVLPLEPMDGEFGYHDLKREWVRLIGLALYKLIQVPMGVCMDYVRDLALFEAISHNLLVYMTSDGQFAKWREEPKPQSIQTSNRFNESAEPTVKPSNQFSEQTVALTSVGMDYDGNTHTFPTQTADTSAIALCISIMQKCLSDEIDQTELQKLRSAEMLAFLCGNETRKTLWEMYIRVFESHRNERGLIKLEKSKIDAYKVLATYMFPAEICKIQLGKLIQSKDMYNNFMKRLDTILLLRDLKAY